MNGCVTSRCRRCCTGTDSGHQGPADLRPTQEGLCLLGNKRKSVTVAGPQVLALADNTSHARPSRACRTWFDPPTSGRPGATERCPQAAPAGAAADRGWAAVSRGGGCRWWHWRRHHAGPALAVELSGRACLVPGMLPSWAFPARCQPSQSCFAARSPLMRSLE